MAKVKLLSFLLATGLIVSTGAAPASGVIAGGLSDVVSEADSSYDDSDIDEYDEYDEYDDEYDDECDMDDVADAADNTADDIEESDENDFADDIEITIEPVIEDDYETEDNAIYTSEDNAYSVGASEIVDYSNGSGYMEAEGVLIDDSDAISEKDIKEFRTDNMYATDNTAEAADDVDDQDDDSGVYGYESENEIVNDSDIPYDENYPGEDSSVSSTEENVLTDVGNITIPDNTDFVLEN